ncbi:MAG: hypothetical protein HQM03_07145 [Magnetococcales bacterium]|nr:hypothetical protein [Magnetococcales bacterium]
MLLRFGVENMYSFREYQEFLLVVPKASNQQAVRGLRNVPGIKEPVVPVAAVYGANASGKSNLLETFSRFVRAIQLSHE